MGDFFSKLWQTVSAWAVWYGNNVVALPQLWTSDRTLFFWIAGSLLAVLIVIIIIIAAASSKKRKKKRTKRKTSYAYPATERRSIESISKKPGTVFVPVKSNESGGDVMFLSLSERIASCTEKLSDNLVSRIRKNSPASLADVVAAYDQCVPAVQAELLELVRSHKMMEAYSRKLAKEESFQQGVLIDAWRFFPDKEVLRSFVDLLASPSEQVQLVGVKLLSTLKEPKTLPLLVLALVQPERFLPARVAEVFLSMPQQSAELLAYMLPELENQYKLQALEIITQTGASFSPANVLACLRNKNRSIRAAAAIALGAGRINEALSELILLAGDKQWQVRAAVAKALGLIGDERAVSILEGMCSDKEGWVAGAAKDALRVYQNK